MRLPFVDVPGRQKLADPTRELLQVPVAQALLRGRLPVGLSPPPLLEATEKAPHAQDLGGPARHRPLSALFGRIPGPFILLPRAGRLRVEAGASARRDVRQP